MSVGDEIKSGLNKLDTDVNKGFDRVNKNLEKSNKAPSAKGPKEQKWDLERLKQIGQKVKSLPGLKTIGTTIESSASYVQKLIKPPDSSQASSPTKSNDANKTMQSFSDAGKKVADFAKQVGKAFSKAPKTSSNAAGEGMDFSVAEGTAGAGEGIEAAGAGEGIGMEVGGAAVAEGAAGAGAAAAGGPVGAIMGVALAAGAAVTALIGVSIAAGKFGQAILESNRSVAEFSGAMSAVFAKYDVEKIQSQKRVGDATAGTAGFLANQQIEFNKALEPFSAAWGNLKNLGGGLLTSLGTAALKFFSWAPEAFNKLLEKLGFDTKEKAGPVQKWMEDVAGIGGRPLPKMPGPPRPIGRPAFGF